MRHHRTLILICHGKTERGWEGEDVSRPLRPSAKRLAQKFGSYLAEHGIECPIIASPAARTRLSAEKAAKVCGTPVRRILYNKWLYRPGLTEQIDILSRHLMRDDVLYFGHEAAMQDLILHLVGQTGAQGFGLGCLAILSVDLDGSTGRIVKAELDQIVMDTDLPEGFPYPTPAAKERRPRPAYYYTQSGVIPYRLTESGARILLVSNKSRRRWGIPKGICEPGFSPQVSAAKEALQEAGVTGPVSNQVLGRYSVPKWGAVCTVQLHAMRVEEELSDGLWAECSRERAWHPACEAASYVDNPQLAELIARFSRSFEHSA